MGTTLTETERSQVSGRAAEKLGRFVRIRPRVYWLLIKHRIIVSGV
jgi:hypothetical protein